MTESSGNLSAATSGHIRRIACIIWLALAGTFFVESVGAREGTASLLSIDAPIGSKQYVDTLIAAVGRIDNVAEAIETISRHLPNVAGVAERNRAIRLLAELNELSFSLADAQQYWHRAYHVTRYSDDYVDYEALYNSAALLMELGDYGESWNQAQLLLNDAFDSRWGDLAALILARISFIDGDGEGALAILERIAERRSPTDIRVVVYLYRFARQMRDQRRVDIAERIARQYYSDSIELRAESGEEEDFFVLPMPTPSVIFGEGALN